MNDTFEIEQSPKYKKGDIVYFRAALRCLEVKEVITDPETNKITGLVGKYSHYSSLTSPIEHCRPATKQEIETFKHE